MFTKIIRFWILSLILLKSQSTLGRKSVTIKETHRDNGYIVHIKGGGALVLGVHVHGLDPVNLGARIGPARACVDLNVLELLGLASAVDAVGSRDHVSLVDDRAAAKVHGPGLVLGPA